MANMIKVLAISVSIFVGTIGSLNAQSQGILPIIDAIKGVNLSNPDSSTVGFVGSRCGNLYMTIGGYFSANANKDSERKIATDFIAKAEIFSFVGVYVDTNVNNKTNAAVVSQGDALSKAYIQEMLAGKRLNNNVFTKLIESDVNFCVSQFSEYQLIYRKIYDSVGKK